MAGEAVQLNYAAGAKSRWRFFHIFILPLIWLPAGIGSRYYYGDEYGGFLITNLPALPLMLLLKHTPFATFSLIAIAFNSLLMVGFGFLMDRLGVRLRSYLIFLLLAAFFILTGICIPPNVPALKTLPPSAQFYPQSLCPAWAIALYLFAIG